MGIDLIDVQKLHKQEPKITVPTKSALLRLKPNDNIKICAGGEKFWVCISQIEGEKITAHVNNDLKNTDKHGLSLGDPVELETCHVYDIIEF